MPAIHRLVLGGIFCLLIATFSLSAQTPTASPAGKTDAEKWREDLRYMASEMPKRHANLFHTMTQEQFNSAVKRLDERIPQLARHQIIVEMARIVAMVGDGHTNIAPTRDPKIAFHTLPILLYQFSDGMFIRSATKEHSELVGHRVLKIGNATVNEAVARAREIIGRDNEMDVRFFAPLLLTMPEVLHALGLAADTLSAEITISDGAKSRAVTLEPVGLADMLPPDSDTTWKHREGWVDMNDGAHAARPMWLQDLDNKYSFNYLQSAKIVYVRLNEVKNKEDESLEEFSKRLFAFIDANPVEKMILDLRRNRGGNGELLKPLLLGTIKSRINEPGRLIVLMGRSTWSAAQFLLNDLEKYTNAVFIGEPSGSKGNAYGDSRRITLPNSGITARVSIYYWQDWSPWDTRQWTAPHVTAELTSYEYRTNQDPAFTAAIAYSNRKTLTQILDEALTEGGADLAVKRFKEFISKPENKYAHTEEPLLIAGQRMLNEKKPYQALILFKLNEEFNPNSFRTYHAIGEALFQTGNKQQAAANLEKALALNPKAYDAAQRLKEINAK